MFCPAEQTLTKIANSHTYCMGIAWKCARNPVIFTMYQTELYVTDVTETGN